VGRDQYEDDFRTGNADLFNVADGLRLVPTPPKIKAALREFVKSVDRVNR